MFMIFNLKYEFIKRMKRLKFQITFKNLMNSNILNKKHAKIDHSYLRAISSFIHKMFNTILFILRNLIDDIAYIARSSCMNSIQKKVQLQRNG